jgi:YegS/Rv2252/BmrU family lipid kinase
MRKTLFLMNGSKEVSTSLQRFLDTCSQILGDQYHFIASNHGKELVEIAKKHASHVDMMVAIGGDGTLNEILNGLLESESSELPILAIIPFGTGNDFYQSSFFQKFHFDLFIDALTHPTVVLTDIGKLVTEHETRYFMNIADIGFGGSVVLSLTEFRQKFGPRFSYGLAILKTFIGFKRPHVSIDAGEFSYKGELLLAAACNGSIFGNGLHIHPGASISDGKLNMTILAKVSLLDYVMNVWKVKHGKRIKHPEAHYFESNTLTLTSSSEELHAETDGEYIRGKSFEISIIPQRLKILSY